MAEVHSEGDIGIDPVLRGGRWVWPDKLGSRDGSDLFDDFGPQPTGPPVTDLGQTFEDILSRENLDDDPYHLNNNVDPDATLLTSLPSCLGPAESPTCKTIAPSSLLTLSTQPAVPAHIPSPEHLLEQKFAGHATLYTTSESEASTSDHPVIDIDSTASIGSMKPLPDTILTSTEPLAKNGRVATGRIVKTRNEKGCMTSARPTIAKPDTPSQSRIFVKHGAADTACQLSKTLPDAGTSWRWRPWPVNVTASGDTSLVEPGWSPTSDKRVKPSLPIQSSTAPKPQPGMSDLDGSDPEHARLHPARQSVSDVTARPGDAGLNLSGHLPHAEATTISPKYAYSCHPSELQYQLAETWQEDDIVKGDKRDPACERAIEYSSVVVRRSSDHWADTKERRKQGPKVLVTDLSLTPLQAVKTAQKCKDRKIQLPRGYRPPTWSRDRAGSQRIGSDRGSSIIAANLGDRHSRSVNLNHRVITVYSLKDDRSETWKVDTDQKITAFCARFGRYAFSKAMSEGTRVACYQAQSDTRDYHSGLLMVPWSGVGLSLKERRLLSHSKPKSYLNMDLPDLSSAGLP